LWTTTWANGSLSLSANCGAHTYLGLHHLHGQEMGGRTAKGMGQAGLGWPTQVHPYAVRSPLRSRGSFSHFALFPLQLHHFGNVILASKIEVLLAWSSVFYASTLGDVPL
jgi:hypothetical protein